MGLLPSWTRHWAQDSGVLLAAQVIGLGASTVVAIAAARHLEPDSWGVFAGLLSAALGISLLIDFGLSTWVLRELSRPDETPASRGRIVGGVLMLNAAIGVFAVAAAAIVTSIINTSADAVAAVAVLVGYSTCAAAAVTLEAHLRATRNVVRVMVTTTVERTFLVAAVLTVVVVDGGVVALAAAYLVGGVARLTVAWHLATRQQLSVVAPPVAEVLRYARRGLPFLVAAAALNIVPRFDLVIVLAFSSTAAGYLAIAERLLMPGHILAGVLGVSLYPFFSGGATRLVGLRAALVTFVVGCVVAAGSILLAAEVVVPAFGASYEEAVPVAQVLLLALPFVYGSSVLLTHLYSLGRERAVLLATAGASVAGTVGVLIGQAAGGVKYAAAAAVGRQALFLLILLALALEPVSTARRAHPETVR